MPVLLAVVLWLLAGGWTGDSTTTAAPRTGTLARGEFTNLTHPTSGTASLVGRRDGRATLVLRGFETRLAPDLFVYLVPGKSTGGLIRGGTRVARLQRNIGDQTYLLPKSVDLEKTSTVVIWCALCSVAFGDAQLDPLT